jgi:hypothetical protein
VEWASCLNYENRFAIDEQTEIRYKPSCPLTALLLLEEVAFRAALVDEFSFVAASEDPALERDSDGVGLGGCDGL